MGAIMIEGLIGDRLGIEMDEVGEWMVDLTSLRSNPALAHLHRKPFRGHPLHYS